MALAQTNNNLSNPWAIGLMGGVSSHYSDVHHSSSDFFQSIPFSKIAYGVYINRQVAEHWSIRTNYLKTSLSGHLKNDEFMFSTPLTDISSQIQYYTHTSKFSPYLLIGVGLQLTDVKPIWLAAENGNALTDLNQLRNSHFVLPFGIGLGYDISNRIRIEAELSARKMFSDYVDGLSKAGNPENKDWNGFATLNFGFKIGNFKDSDKDGIIDKKDFCPEVPGKLIFNGCPDSDEDGIQDSEDSCPFDPGDKINNGCPDSDKDGFIDIDDDCPNIFGAFKGCPDSDKDGILDAKDDCPNEKGDLIHNGCPDSDNDGIIDTKDKCPDTFGFIENEGCPKIDTDMDGVPDKDDLCPIYPGPKSNDGCPIPKTDILSKPSPLTVYFEDNSSLLKISEGNKLRPLLQYLEQNPQAYLVLEGYADHRGEQDYNLELSGNRNTSVQMWFLNNGITTQRIQMKALGEKPPLSNPNLSENRCVQVEIIDRNQ